MKLAKSLLLGSAAGLMAVAGANAADLPVRAAAPAVDYVRVCNAYGAGFFFIPGTETCLRIGGYIRADYIVSDTRRATEAAERGANHYTFFARAKVNLDSRTGTEYGLLRTFTSVDFDTVGTDAGPNRSRIVNAYVQFGGLTAGRIASFFQWKVEQTYSSFVTSTSSTYAQTNVLAYTASFGNGFSATVSLEDGGRQAGIRGVGGANVGYAGREVPDVVGVLAVDQGWGAARLAGAVHQIEPAVAGLSGDKWGWAVLAGVEVKLPALSPTTTLWVQGTYSDGASSFGGGSAAPARFAGNAAFQNADAWVVGTSLQTTKIWAVSAGLGHSWSPTLRSNFHAAYADVDVPTGSAGSDWTAWNVGANLIWSPVSGLGIGIEGQYANVDAKGPNRFIPVRGVNRDSDDVWEARLRIQRDF